MIIANSLTKSFGSVTAVENISLQINTGEIYGLLGPNGAGKTTTLRMLYGLMKPTAGTLFLNEIDIAAKPLLAQKQMGVLADANRLYHRLTARENITYFGQLQGLSKQQIQQRIHYFCELLTMGEIIDRPTLGFSQGERMKVSIARALIHDPDYILLDEPTNGLDVVTTKAIRQLLTQLKSEQKCIIFSSHVMHEVANLCDRIGIIRSGQMMCQGSVEQVIANANVDKGENEGQIIDLEQAFIHFAYDHTLESRSA